MALKIEDGRGSGVAAGVTPDNRILTVSRTYNSAEAGGLIGTSYGLATGVLSLTSAGESAALYLKNTDPTNQLVISSISFFFGKATVAGDVILRTYTPITGGTVVSAGAAVVPFNRNFGITIPPVCTALLGSEAKTVAGTKIIERVFQDASHDEIQAFDVIPNGSSVVWTIQPPTGNTSMKVSLVVGMVFVNPANV